MRYVKIIANFKLKSKNSQPARSVAYAASIALALLTGCAPQRAPVAPRTVPVAVQTAAPPLGPMQRARLGRRLDAIFKPFAAGVKSLCVIDGTGAPVYARTCGRAVIAASTQKIIVAASAFRYLGAAYRFHTQFASQDRVVGGTLGNDRWLIGSGDPILTSNDLRGGVKLLASAGLRRISGGIAVDATALTGPERNPLWDPTDANYGFSAATSGVSLDQDTVEFHIHPGAPGAPARVEMRPRSRVVTFTGSVLTVPQGFGTSVTINPVDRPDSFVVRGEIAATGHEAVYYVPVSGIPNYVADVVEAMLEERGITTARSGRTGIAPHNLQTLWDHRSPPLRFTIAKMLFESNNHIAEQLLRTLGRAQGGSGNDARGLAAETAFLRSQNVPVDGLHLVDGSGLAVANRVSGLTLATLLSRSEQTPGGNPIYFALPRGGIEGTLKEYRFTTALGRVRAKSGHIGGVDALTGYVTTRRHGRLVFAYILDTPLDRWKADAAIAAAVDALAEF
jgi:D-alanyl-D-alanine carboxypeptidase/D-alanyl-D-alanine-endopeptidase (penicillin-binding protein 4)